jgi:FMN phosphatase YigB (HAD superfamily)
MTKSLSHIRAIVWDLDGTLYRYEQDFLQACDIAAARTAISLGLQMELNEAIALATRSYAEHGSSFRFFADHGIRYEDFHHPYHTLVDATLLRKNAAMKAGLETLGIPMVILTNASRPWAIRTLGHLEYDALFPEEKLLALEDVGYVAKSRGDAGFKKALDILGTNAAETLMVEDLAQNLVHAKTLGLETALVHHALTQSPAHVDYLFDETLELLQALKN